MYKIPRLTSDGPMAPAAEPPPEAASPATAAPPYEHVASFYSLSVQLTGFGEVELLGTGVGGLYLAWLHRVFPDALPELLDVWSSVERDYPPPERALGLQERILDDAELGPFARAILALWYTATWTPPKSEDVNLPASENVDRSFGAAYPEGLMWRAAIGAHPGGAKPTGFGTWAYAPEGG